MQWSRTLRRSGAFFLAAVAVWVLTLTADMGAAAEGLLALGDRADFVETALSLELGAAAPGDEPFADMTGWERLVLGQSALLRAEVTAAEAEPDLMDNAAELPLPSESMPVETPVLSGTGPGPQILIIHTHATEAYTPDGEDTYEESDPYRTTDREHNMVHIGDALANAFGTAGFAVLHDRALYDYPEYSGAYGRTYDAVAAYLEAYPSISLVLDVHRDALYDGDGVPAPTDDGSGGAQVYFVVGGDSDGLHPNYEVNLALANTLDRAVAAAKPGLSRGVSLRSSHFNQQLSPGYLLLEVGSHGNTLAQAREAAEALVEAIAPTLWSLLEENGS